MQDENTLEEIAESLPEHLADDFGATWAFIATYHMVWPFGSQNAVSHTMFDVPCLDFEILLPPKLRF